MARLKGVPAKTVNGRPRTRLTVISVCGCNQNYPCAKAARYWVDDDMIALEAHLFLTARAGTKSPEQMVKNAEKQRARRAG